VSGADHRTWEEELAAYVLGALDADEREAIEAHIAGCERCRGDLRWIGAAVEVLPASVEPREPPARLRRRLFATVRDEARPGGAMAAGSAERRRLLPPVLRPGLALVAVTVLIAAGVAGFLVGGSGGVDETTLTARATEAAPAGAAATIAREGDAGTLRTTGLRQPAAGGVYQVWIRDGERIAPSTVFAVDRNGEGVAAIPAGLDGGDEVMVTREPRGGSDAPTTEPLLSARLG
jgi:anti-sigma factor RsiW